jgi:hypothetical protein
MAVLGCALPAAASPAETQLALAAQPAVKLAVRGEGWVRVSGAQLHAAGLAAGADPSALQLFADGVEQAIRVTGNGDETLDDGDAVEFYGTGRDTLWTGTRTYWLVSGARGARVPYVVNPRGGTAVPSFSATETLRQRITYYAPLLNGDDSNFLGDSIVAAPVTETVTLGPVADPTTGVLRVALLGVTAGAHVVAVTAGGAPLGTCTASGTDASTCELALPTVAAGAQSFGLASVGVAPDISLLSSLSVVYDHAYLAAGDRLKLTAQPKTRVTVGGFSTADVRVVDVTAPAAPVELVVGISGVAGNWVASFDVADGETDRTLWTFTDASVAAPVAVTASRPSSWADPRAGELLIISNGALLEAVRPLAERRAAEGWSVALVDVQDVYDEFGAGDKSAFAIRDFIRSAVARWTIPPRDVLLVGDATFDPRDFTGKGDFDLVPTKLVDTAQMETSSDGWFGDLDDDGLPDVAIGRIPARTAAVTSDVVRKTLAYAGKDALPRGALFVTDVDDTGLDFEAASANSEAAVSDLMPVTRFARSDASMTAAGLLAKLDAGPFLVNYFGHGSVEVWDDLLSSTDAAALTNAQPSITVSMNCLNGFFHDLYTTSLAEALLEAPNGGAVAVWASSTLTSFAPQETFNRAFLSRVARGSLGAADLAAKRAITDVDARRTWMIFGDPTLFGAPMGAPPPDAGASTDAGASPDAGTSSDASAFRDAGASPDAGASSEAGAPLDAGLDGSGTSPPDASNDGPRTDGAHDGATAGPAGSGCACDLRGGGRPPASGLGAAGLVLAASFLRRRR